MATINHLATVVPIRAQTTAQRPVSIPVDFGSIQYETRRWPYVLALPVMWLLAFWAATKRWVRHLVGLPPGINSLWFDGLGESCKLVKGTAATTHALDEIYANVPRANGLGAWLDTFWLNMRNCQAVRNRKKLVELQLMWAVKCFEDQAEIFFLSIACGSAQAVVEGLVSLGELGRKVRVVLVDKDPMALGHALSLAKRHGLDKQFEAKCVTAGRIEELGLQPHVVEMCGLLDYFPKPHAVRLLRKVRRVMASEGVLITCNIAPNPETPFVRHVVDWPMIYRTQSELEELLSEAGFEQFRLTYEPLQIHGVAVARKM